LQIKSIEREIELLKTLQHKNIVGYLGTVTTPSSINIILQYVGGGTLMDKYKRYDLNEALIRRYTEHILLGIEYLHFNNVIHRDIKSANILVD
jgi:serine/threonine protein kinase